MPTTFYTPPAVRRYFAVSPDPNSANGGTSLDQIAGNTSAGITADTANFPAGVIPDVTAALPVTSANVAWNPTNITRDNEVTGYRASRTPIPLLRTPQVDFTADAYQYIVEKFLKYAMGSEGTIVGSVAPYTHPLSPIGYGSTIQPSFLMQLIRDNINHKMSGVALESVNLTFAPAAAGTISVVGHPLYVHQELSSVAQPTGVLTQPAAEPMLIRDAVVVFDGGATSAVGVSEFTFGYANNGKYDRQVSGRCIDTKTVGTPSLLRKLHFPAYHKISGRQAVTFGLNYLDVQEAQEIAAQWGQIQKIVVTVADPNSTTNLIRFTMYATELNGGGVDALQATGDQTAAFTGSAHYSASDGTDILVESVNSLATPI
jgi:hypothetical protein